MEFAFPFPKRFTLALIASAFGPNVDQPSKIGIGQDEQSFRQSASPKEVSLTFNSTGSERTVVITIPKPTTPKELGADSGGRRLGLALHQLRIANLAEQQPWLLPRAEINPDSDLRTFAGAFPVSDAKPEPRRPARFDTALPHLSTVTKAIKH